MIQVGQVYKYDQRVAVGRFLVVHPLAPATSPGSWRCRNIVTGEYFECSENQILDRGELTSAQSGQLWAKDDEEVVIRLVECTALGDTWVWAVVSEGPKKFHRVEVPEDYLFRRFSRIDGLDGKAVA